MSTLVSATGLVEPLSSLEQRAFSQDPLVITASDYSLFLNDQAVTDEVHLYDQKMGSDSLTASIVREGLPGAYCYFVISGCEDNEVTYVSLLSKIAYCSWLQNGLQSEQDAEEETSLTSNQIGFSLKKFVSQQPSLPRQNPNETTDNSTSEWGSVEKIAGAAGIFLFGYRMLQGYRAIPSEAALNVDEVRNNSSAPIPNQRKIVTRSTSEPILSREKSDTTSRSCSLNDLSRINSNNPQAPDPRLEKSTQSVNIFHEDEIKRTRDPNIQSFHQTCIMANATTVELENAAKELEQLNHHIDAAKKRALIGLCNYGKVYVVAHASSLLLDMVVPFGSVAAHVVTEVTSNLGVLKGIISEAAPYLLQEAQGAVMKRSAAAVVRDPIPRESLSPQNLKAKITSLAGEDLKAIGRGVSDLASSRSHFMETKEKFQQALQEYQTAIQKVDEAYRNAVESEDHDKEYWQNINEEKNSRRGTMRFIQGDLIRDDAPIPLGGFSLADDKIFFRLYVKDHPEDLIGAHLLDQKPLIDPDQGILIGEVHVPRGTRMQQLNFKTSPESDHGIRQVRLIDMISKNLFHAE